MSRPHITHTHITSTADPPSAEASASARAAAAAACCIWRVPALPIGAFHFSQGLEYAVECGWVKDEASALEWIDGIALAQACRRSTCRCWSDCALPGGRMTRRMFCAGTHS